ncbi:kinesin-like protein KIN-12B [Morus notabilis]|uniref:kinesin-like protein KIN-12B n=1 Tax=Morus notabilis TaxID=981085 RepID=UPI000CED7EB0|nr:kinesin-like protein KIN-12B [Morus notabilis]
MKHFMQPRNAILRETTMESPASPNPTAAKPRPSRKQRGSKENAPPSDPNTLPPIPKHSPAISAAKLKSPLPPRPPSSNPLKRKLNMETVPENSIFGTCESGVQVVVRMRPAHKEKDEEEMIVQKISNDSLTINGQTFTFDSVADTEATQLDIFQLVGAPLVENCMAGFNSSVFAYGQTGSGKTYTMWGPANALLDANISSDQQGLTPRVFERLFARINEEQIKNADRQLKYQCHCSFLEIYNEQITDLLDPNQRNLQIREDVKSGIYVDNLTEECVRSMSDVKQLLMKGLSNRRTGATSINAESSRSHTVFTCVLESRCKSIDGMSSFKTSRINLVDLAGSERQKLTGAAGERLKEAGNINRSLSQLGNLINILAEISQTGKQRHIPYRDSRLTFLLQESLGGNAKLAMVCAISPTQSCKSETFSTLRFAQRAKSIKNKAVVNEVMEDDVNHLREVIRQLRDELHRIKANGGSNPVEANGGHSAAWIRRSLHLLKASLNRPMTLPHIDDDGDEEMEIDEEAVEKLCIQVEKQSAASEDSKIIDLNKLETITSDVHSELRSSNAPRQCAPEGECTKEQDSEDTDVKMEEGISEQDEAMIVDCDVSVAGNTEYSKGNLLNSHYAPKDNDQATGILDKNSFELSSEDNSTLSSSVNKKLNEEPESGKDDCFSCPKLEPVSEEPACILVEEKYDESPNSSMNGASPSIRIVPSEISPVLKSPTPSISPRTNSSRKSLRTSSMLSASQKDPMDKSKLIQEAVRNSLAKSLKGSSSNDLFTQASKSFLAPTEHLAASIRHGLEIIDNHRQSSAFRRSSYRFSYKPAESKIVLPISKVDVGVQTIHDVQPEELMEFTCGSCKSRIQLEAEANDSSNLQLVPVDGLEFTEKLKIQVPKAVEKVLAGAIRREMALEDLCAKQNSEIVQLNRLVQQYKHERECNSIIAQTREDKILRLESLMDGILPTEDFMEEELVLLKHEHELLKEKYDNHPEVLRTKIELKRVQDEMENLRNFCDMGEREVLLEELQDLRSQLQFYVDSSSSSRKRNPVLQLTYSCDPSVAPPLSTISESKEETAEDKFEQERKSWTEVESKWISLSEELRIELESSRSQAEKKERELETEKKCAEELKEAMQLAMEGHARMLEQYADLEEKHMQLLARHRRIQEGIEDVKKAAVKAGVRGAESKFINALAAEISALKVERERERRYLRDENKGLQAQLRDTAEAVQAAGELLVRLKEAEEAVATAQKQAMEAKQETEKAYKQMDKLKKKHEKETLHDLLAESRLPKGAIRPAFDDMAKYNIEEPCDASDQQWREEFEPFYNGEDGELPKLAEPSSWFSGYDRCNI